MEKERMEQALKLHQEFERLKLLDKMLEQKIVHFGISNQQFSAYHLSVESEELDKRLAVVAREYIKERMPLAQKEFLEL